MCVRTKTSYGCGCVFKDTNECDTVECTDLERFHYQKCFDCPKCKSAGEEGTRGKEGKGRYAQQIRRARTKSQSSNCSAEQGAGTHPAEMTRSSALPDDEPPASPWVPGEGERRKWATIHRKMADEAWLSEHERRLSTIHGSTSSSPIPKSARDSSKRRSMERKGPIYDKGEKRGDESHSPTMPIQIVMRKKLDGHHSHRHVLSRHQYSQTGDESLPDSMPSYRSGHLIYSPNGSQHTDSMDGHQHDFCTTSPTPSKHSSKRHSSKTNSRLHVYMQPPYWYDDTLPTYDHYSPQSSKAYKSSTGRYSRMEPISPHYVRYRTSH